MDAPPVQYVTTSDGFRIAYTVSGQGEPFVMMPEHASHAQLAWSWPGNSSLLEGLRARFRLVCYDGRGQGLSTRGLTPQFALSDWQRDLETVVDHLHLDRFVLFGPRFNGHVAIRFAAAQPGRVRALILANCALNLSVATKGQREIASEDWEWTIRVISGSLPGEDRDWNMDFIRQSVTQHDFLTMTDAIGVSEIGGYLRNLRVPTLLLRVRGYTTLTQEAAAELAAAISDSRLVVTDGFMNRIDAEQGLRAIDAFLADLPEPTAEAGIAADGLSHREIEVLRLLAAGKSNAQIADELVISQNTVIRHVSNIFAKIGAANRAEAASYATRNGLA
jgi:DNA-binding CsgD family transcriptional regulator/pimeloyl-ACP methyl ester carboxylesterase